MSSLTATTDKDCATETHAVENEPLHVYSPSVYVNLINLSENQGKDPRKTSLIKILNTSFSIQKYFIVCSL